MSIRKRLLALGAGLALAAGVVPSMAVANATVEPQATCHLVAEKPFREGANVSAWTGRVGCASPTSVTMLLKRYKSVLPDTTVVKLVRTLSDSRQKLSAPLTSGHVYFSRTESATGASAQSGHWRAP